MPAITTSQDAAYYVYDSRDSDGIAWVLTTELLLAANRSNCDVIDATRSARLATVATGVLCDSKEFSSETELSSATEDSSGLSPSAFLGQCVRWKCLYNEFHEINARSQEGHGSLSVSRR